jgi:hypothetical protein
MYDAIDYLMDALAVAKLRMHSRLAESETLLTLSKTCAARYYICGYTHTRKHTNACASATPCSATRQPPALCAGTGRAPPHLTRPASVRISAL